MNVDVYIFFKICRDFFRIFLAFYVMFCAYHTIPIRVAETDPSQCPPSRRPRPRLWTMILTKSQIFPSNSNSPYNLSSILVNCHQWHMGIFSPLKKLCPQQPLNRYCLLFFILSNKPNKMKKGERENNSISANTWCAEMRNQQRLRVIALRLWDLGSLEKERSAKSMNQLRIYSLFFHQTSDPQILIFCVVLYKRRQPHD